MELDSLMLSNFRNFESVNMKFAPGLNYLIGENGAGKTSILEALHLYWNGRSFRTNGLSKIVRSEASNAVVHGKVINVNESHSGSLVSFGLSLKGGQKGKVVKYDGEIVKKSSKLAKLFPVFYYAPSSVSLISGSPSERRKLINWFMFHVEPKFNEYYQKIKVAVNQRNKLLKTTHFDQLYTNVEFDFWEKEVASNSEFIAVTIDKHITALNHEFRKFVSDKNFSGDSDKRTFSELKINIEKGWKSSEYSLLELQKIKRKAEQRNAVSTNGFHRSDLLLLDKNDKKIGELSRGEEKSLGLLLVLSMLALMKSYNKTVLLLIDDLHSELDNKNARFIITTITKLGFQSLVTCIDDSNIFHLNEEQKSKLFHVKQGNICEDN